MTAGTKSSSPLDAGWHAEVREDGHAYACVGAIINFEATVCWNSVQQATRSIRTINDHSLSVFLSNGERAVVE